MPVEPALPPRKRLRIRKLDGVAMWVAAEEKCLPSTEPKGAQQRLAVLVRILGAHHGAELSEAIECIPDDLR